MLDFNTWRESSAATRAKQAAANGTGPDVADVFGHATPPPAITKKLLKKLESKKAIKPDYSFDNFIRQAEKISTELEKSEKDAEAEEKELDQKEKDLEKKRDASKKKIDPQQGSKKTWERKSGEPPSEPDSGSSPDSEESPSGTPPPRSTKTVHKSTKARQTPDKTRP